MSLFSGEVLKLVPVPVMVTALPMAPLVGENVIVCGTVTTKFVALIPDSPPTVTVMGPVVALTGTVVCSCVAVAAVTVATRPLNLTVLFAKVVL